MIIVAILIVYWYRMKQQRRRIRQTFIKQIAQNIQLSGRLDSLSQEQLSKEFNNIDQSGDGYLQKQEMKDWMCGGDSHLASSTSLISTPCGLSWMWMAAARWTSWNSPASCSSVAASTMKRLAPRKPSQ